MSQMTIEELEGALHAQRETLALILAWLADMADDDAEALWTAMEERAELEDHQEDPGAVPADGLAIEGAMMTEFQLILRAARARLAEQREKAGR